MIPSQAFIPRNLKVDTLVSNEVTTDYLALGNGIATDISNDEDLTADSQFLLSTQHAIKTYIDDGVATDLTNHINNDTDAHFGQDLKTTGSPTFESLTVTTGKIGVRTFNGGTWYKIYTIAQDTNDHLAIELHTKDVDTRDVDIKKFLIGSKTGDLAIDVKHDITNGSLTNQPRLIVVGPSISTTSIALSYTGGADGFSVDMTPGEVVYQSFITYSDRYFRAFQIDKQGLVLGTYTPYLYEGVGIEGALLATGDPIALGVSARALQLFNFTTAGPLPRMIKGQAYTFALRSTTTGTIRVWGTTGNVYTDGRAGFNIDLPADYDLKFEIRDYVPDNDTSRDVYIFGQPEAGSITYMRIDSSMTSPLWVADGTGAWPDSYNPPTLIDFDTDENPPNINTQLGSIIAHSTDDATYVTNPDAAPIISRGAITARNNIMADYQVDRCRFIVGQPNSYNRRQVWYYGTNDLNPGNEGSLYGGDGPILRVGSLQSDGDTLNIVSEGSVFYGINSDNDPMSTGDFAYARIKPNRFQLYNSISSVGTSTFIVDNTALKWRVAGAANDMFEATAAGIKSNSVIEAVGQISTADTTDSTSVSTGALVVDGGAGIAKTLYVGTGINSGTTIAATGQISTDDTTDSTSVSTGALVVDGGAGIAKTLYVGTGIYLPTSGGTAGLLNYYETGTVSMTFSGPFVTPQTRDVTFVRIDSIVMITIPTTLADSNTATFIVTTTGNQLPTRVRPAVDKKEIGRIQKNLAIQVGEFVIKTNGNIEIYSDLVAGTFQNTGTNGFTESEFTYRV